MLNEGNQMHNFISSSGSDFLTSYGSGSTSQKVTVPTVPVPVPLHSSACQIAQIMLSGFSVLTMMGTKMVGWVTSCKKKFLSH
jgi:hypothetical protein